MSGEIVLRLEDVSKRYKLGVIGYQTLSEELQSWWARVRGREDPNRKIREDGRTARLSGKGSFWALRDVSFEVRRGELVGIVGRNGAGKSTLLKLLSRITAPTTGRILIRGRVGSLLEVGTGFHPELTGRENVYLNGAILGMRRTEIARKMDEILAFAEVESFADTPVKRYSSGMYVRLAFAVAAHLEAEILFVDEVLAVGDIAFQKKCIGKMNELTREGRTVLFVSHNMSTIASLCRRGILLEEGRVLADGEVNATVARYLSLVRGRPSAAGGYVSLAEHPGRERRGKGPLRLTYCRLVDDRGRPRAYFVSGADLRIVIGYRRRSRISGRRTTVYVTFVDGDQSRLFTCSNDVLGHEFEALDEEGEVECVIPRLPLAPGRYTFDVGCRVGPKLSDAVRGVAEFDVVAGDYFGSGHVPPPGCGKVFVDHYWTHRARPAASAHAVGEKA